MKSEINNMGNMLYLEDSLTVTLTSSLTSSTVVSVDGRFTVTLEGVSGATAYSLQVSNLNPLVKKALPSITGTGQFTSGFNNNRYPTPDNIVWTVNPNLENSWVTLTSFQTAGYFIVDGCFRLARIIKVAGGGFQPGAKAHFFLEKQVPVIQ